MLGERGPLNAWGKEATLSVVALSLGENDSEKRVVVCVVEHLDLGLGAAVASAYVHGQLGVTAHIRQRHGQFQY